MTCVSYPPAIQDLLTDEHLPDLGPGRPNAGAAARLKALTCETMFPEGKVRNREAAEACRAGLWLYHDFLDESHEISQELHSAEGSYWHALMHRREPDYSNAKYWFRRVGTHPVYEPLRVEAAALVRDEAEFLRTQDRWDPYRFVDFCESAAEGGAGALLCRKIQRREWDLLFDHCYCLAMA